MSFATLLTRQLRARPWPTILLAFTVAVVAALVTAVPRLVTDLDDRQLSQRLGSLSAIAGDVAGTWRVPSPLDTQLHDPWDGYQASAEAIRQAQPEPLRSLLAPAQFVSEYSQTISSTPPTESGYYTITWHLLIDPALAEHARLVEGDWPGLSENVDQIQQVAVLDSAAQRMGWQVGEEIGPGLELSGTYETNDAADVRWEHIELGRRYNELNDPNRGIELELGAFLPAALAGGDPLLRLQAPFENTVWFRLDSAAVGSTGVAVEGLAAQVTGLTAATWPMGTGADDPAAKSVRLVTELGPVLDEIAAQQRTTRTLVAVSAAGPLGVGAVLVLLAAQLVADRRRGTLVLTAARGLSARQQLGLAAAEGLAAGLPAAALGHLVASAISPGSDSLFAWALTLFLALVPPLALMAALRPVAPTRATARSSRWRLAGEALVVLAAAAATWQLIVTPATGALAVAAPLLLALAVCLLVVRLYPLPLRAATAAFGAGRGLVGFLGSARALRSPAGGRLPVAAIVLGATMAVASTALLGTITNSVTSAGWNSVGADVRVSGPTITDEVADQLRSLDGVSAVARVREASGNAALAQGGSSTILRLWLADSQLADVYAAGPGDPLPASLFGDGATSVVVGGVDASGSATLTGLGDVDVAAKLDQLPGVRTGAAWALADAARWNDADQIAATLALVSIAPDADPAQVAAEVAELLPTANVVTAAGELDQLRSSPTLSGLQAIFALLAAASLVLLLLATLTAQALAAESRRSLGAVLRTLGLPPGKLRSLTAWELGPIVVVAIVVGAAAGLGIAALLARSVDLSALTGAAETLFRPDPLSLALVLGGLVVATGLTIVVSAALSGRVDVASQLRLGEER